MEDVFELSKFDEYKEDNRREVKAAEGGLPKSLWDTYSSMHLAVREAIANCLVNADYFQRWSVSSNDILTGLFFQIRGRSSRARNRC